MQQIKVVKTFESSRNLAEPDKKPIDLIYLPTSPRTLRFRRESQLIRKMTRKSILGDETSLNDETDWREFWSNRIKDVIIQIRVMKRLSNRKALEAKSESNKKRINGCAIL